MSFQRRAVRSPQVAGADQRVQPGITEQDGPGPPQGVEVTQATGPVLELGFQRAGRGAVATVTLGVGLAIFAGSIQAIGLLPTGFIPKEDASRIVVSLELPPGSTLITALPLLVTTGQMMLGYPHVRLPRRLARMRLDPLKLRRTVLRLRPITRRLERVLKPRYAMLFSRRNERPLGLLLFVIAFALFLPVPLSGWFPAIALFVFGVGLVERDGLIASLGLAIGVASVVLTAAILTSLAAGAEAIMH